MRLTVKMHPLDCLSPREMLPDSQHGWGVGAAGRGREEPPQAAGSPEKLRAAATRGQWRQGRAARMADGGGGEQGAGRRARPTVLPSRLHLRGFPCSQAKGFV